MMPATPAIAQWPLVFSASWYLHAHTCHIIACAQRQVLSWQQSSCLRAGAQGDADGPQRQH
jgi:hypothetical protein